MLKMRCSVRRHPFKDGDIVKLRMIGIPHSNRAECLHVLKHRGPHKIEIACYGKFELQGWAPAIWIEGFNRRAFDAKFFKKYG